VAPFPEPGAWFDPADPGTGLFIEVQNGVLVGTVFGFDNNGDDAWMLFSGPLVSGETVNSEGVEILWQLDADLNQFSDGKCFVDCTGGRADNSGEMTTTVGTIRLEVLGRAQARFSINSGPEVDPDFRTAR